MPRNYALFSEPRSIYLPFAAAFQPRNPRRDKHAISRWKLPPTQFNGVANLTGALDPTHDDAGIRMDHGDVPGGPLFLKLCVEVFGRPRFFSCFDQFFCMAFAQLTYRESLRDIETCLRAMGPKLYHAGFRGRIARSTLADANHQRDWRIYADFAQILIQRAKQLYLGNDLAFNLDATVYALDATTIDLCLSLFPWAKFRRAKGAVKLHTLLNLQGNISEFILISDGKLHDVNVLDHLVPVPGAYYVMDRGYLDFERLYVLHQAKKRVLTRYRSKRNFNFRRRYSGQEVDKSTGVQCDQTVVLETYNSATGLARSHCVAFAYYDAERDKRLVFLTNNFEPCRHPDDCGPVQVALADRAVLQVDQAAPAYQGLLRDFPERGEDPGVDCDQRLRPRGHCQEGTQTPKEPLRNLTNLERGPFRENAHFRGSFEQKLSKREYSKF